MSVTIKDVAALAGVSPSTVSRTCKDHPSISNETKIRVRQAMLQLGYENNVQQSAASQDSKTIGIILPPSSRETYENPFYLEAIRGISQFCNGRQYYSSVITGKDNEEVLAAIHSAVQRNQVDGFIILFSKKNDPIVEALYNEGLLYVLIGKAYQYVGQTICVDNDNLLAGQEATEYLYQLGHRRIAYLGYESTLLYSADRKTGYQVAMLQHNLTVDPSFCLEVNGVPETDTPKIGELLKRPDRPTAIVVCDDIIALALKQSCIQLGLSIPKDLSIISFNNSLFSRLTSPQLTSVDVNAFQLGVEASSQLINHIENPNLLATKIIVPHELHQRESCCPPEHLPEK